MTTYLHVSRMPPSPSGVALLARDMNLVYAQLGKLTVHELPPEPRASQSIALSVRTFLSIRRLVPRGSRDHIVAVELAGRGLAEMWSSWALARCRRRVWLTVHDVPAVSGAAMMTAALDRRGLRKLGMTLSRLVGRRAERDLLRRADRVFVLSKAGAAELQRSYRLDRRVDPIPHVLAPAESDAPQTEKRIFIPGYISAAQDVFPVVDLLQRLPTEWRLAVGAGQASVLEAISARAVVAQVDDRVENRGFLTEDALEREFSRAAIVVRWRARGWGLSGARYAVSGPIIRALGRSCAVVTNDDRGVSECLAAANAVVVRGGTDGEAEMVGAVLKLAYDDTSRESCACAGLAHIQAMHSPRVVALAMAYDVPCGPTWRKGGMWR